MLRRIALRIARRRARPLGTAFAGSPALEASTPRPPRSASRRRARRLSPRAASEGPSYGDSVTFDVSTDATSQPFVHLKCFQNGSLVLESWQAWAHSDRMFTLGGSPAWQGGAGDCTAYLENWDSYSKNGRTTSLASTSFHVDA